jgi:hypothetical protein
MSHLPSIEVLYKDTALAIKQNQLLVLLNQPPKDDWIQTHPMQKNLKYLPIERMEMLMSAIFKSWRVEIKQTQLIGNSVVVTVRVHYQDVISGEWSWTDGIGAVAMQTDKGSGATDFNALKSNSVQLAAPAAETYAFKDACEKLGKLFGKDLNRSRDIGYDQLLKQEEKLKSLEEKFEK